MMALAGGFCRGELHLAAAHPSLSGDNNKCPTFGEGGWQQVCLEEHIFYLPPAEAKPFPLKQWYLTPLCSSGSDKTQHRQEE